MNWRKRVVLLLALLCTFSVRAASADNSFADFRAAHQDFMRLLTGEGKDVEMRYLFQPKSEAQTEEGRFSLHDLLFSAELPVPVTRDFFFRVAPEYETRFYRFNHVDILGADPGDLTLHKITLGAGFGEFFSDDWLLTGKFTPGVLSDLNQPLNHKQMEYFGQLILAHQYNENTQLLTGAVSDRLFEGTNVYPVLALRFQSTDRRWHVKLTPPIDARLGYEADLQNQLYLKFWQTGDRYRMFFKEADASFNLRIEERRIGAGLLHRFDEHFNFSFEFGTTLLSRFEFEVDDPELSDEDADPAVYSYLSLGYSL